MDALGIDHLALSGHKLYAPFGVGVLVARGARASPRPSRCCTAAARSRACSTTASSGATRPRASRPARPNVFGAIALGAACDALSRVRHGVLAAEELTLGALLRERLAAVPGLRVLEQWRGDDVPRVALASFHVPSIEAGELARRLAEEHAISVRAGAFCAHPLVRHLRGVARANAPGGGAVRASLGLGSGIDDVEVLADALGSLIGAQREARRRRARPRASRRRSPASPRARPIAFDAPPLPSSISSLPSHSSSCPPPPVLSLPPLCTFHFLPI